MFCTMIFDPADGLRHGEQALCKAEAKPCKLILCVAKRDAVAAENQQHHGHADALVAVDEAMILHKAAAGRGSLADDVRVGLHAGKGSGGTGECAVDEAGFAHAVGAAGRWGGRSAFLCSTWSA